MRSVPKNSLIRGSIDEVRGDVLHGWIFGAMPEARPLILVDNEPARRLNSEVARPDVCAAFGVGEDVRPGFSFRLPPAKKGAKVELFGATADGVYLVAESRLEYPIIENNLYKQLERAARTARQKDAAGIVCWDGAHNPAGRAKTLYDIAAAQRPAVLVCYLHPEFGGKIWEPLINWDGNIVAIPWPRRNEGHKLLARYGINFGTVWISKPRVPSFMLAAAVSRPGTRFVLDIDDNEDAFYAQEDLASACYDLPGKNLAHFLMEQLSARTVSGPALQEKFGGGIVRHARRPMPMKRRAAGAVRNIVFCGTAWPHKNVAAIARAVNMLAAGENMKLHFHVYGDIQPPGLRHDLEDAGAIIHGIASFAELPKLLADADVLISGYFPDDNEAAREIAKYQVPAKISDALAAGKPILVPESEATADLAEIPGIYIFNKTSLLEKLLAALQHEKTVYMPADFTPAGAYPAFAAAEKRAKRQPLTGLQCSRLTAPDGAEPRALVLLWKQQDAGFYGRRVDQIARSCKRQYPDHKVIVLEFMHKGEECWLLEDQAGKCGFADQPPDVFYDEKSALAELQEQKKHGLRKDAVFYQILEWDCPQALRKELANFLYRQRLFPDNALFVIFPVVEQLEEVEDLLRPYRKIVDVVDNELGWANDNVRRARVLDQYFRVMRHADKVVFNTPVNRDFFLERNFADEARTCVIPNWYSLPDGCILKKSAIAGPEKHVIYSGNMNDRIDWKLLEAMAKMENVRLHLAGAADRASWQLLNLIADGAIYHGILSEAELLELCSFMDAAIVPHKRDKIAEYMNPMKSQMYRVAGLPIICPSWLGNASGNVATYESGEQAIDILQKLLKSKVIICHLQKFESQEIKEYMELVARCIAHFTESGVEA